MDAKSDGIWQIEIDASADPSGARLEALLRARFAYERAQAARTQWFKLFLFLLACIFAGASIRASVIADHWPAIIAVSGLLLSRALVAALQESLHYRGWRRAAARFGGVRAPEA